MAEARATFSESWYRIAGQRLGLRPDVIIRRQRYRGERWYVLQNPFAARYFRLRPEAYDFVARLQPDRTVQEIWLDCVERSPDTAPGQEAVLQLLAQLYYANLLHYEQAADSAQLFQRYRERRQRETAALFLNLMFMRFPLLDPDRFLKRTLPAAGKLIGKLGAVLWFVVVGWGVKVAIDNAPALLQQGQGILAPSNLALLYLALVIIKTLHEFGHAYFCRKFGGEVHVMGILLMIFTPVPYVDATASWGFRRRYQRVLVGAAGMIVEIFVAALATFLWANTAPGVVHSLAYNAMFIASVSTVIFNANPLLRFDGYYILSDLLEIPNLSQRANDEMRHLWERHVFGVRQSESPAHSASEAGWLGFYGVTSGVYRVIVFGGVLLFVADRFLIVGLVMAAVCLVSWVTVPVGQFVHYLASSPRLARVRPRAIGVTAVLAALALILLAVVPFPRHFRAPGVVEARTRTEVATGVAGTVREILAVPGSRVVRGQPLVRMTSRQLQADLAQSLAQYEEASARLRNAISDSTADIPAMRVQVATAAEDVAKLKIDEAGLILRAPNDGIWVAPRLQDAVGATFVRGAPLGLVIDPLAFEFVAAIDQTDADTAFSVRPSRAEVRLRGQAGIDIAVDRWKVVPRGQRELPSAALGWMGGGNIPVDQQQPETAAEPFFEVHAQLAATPAALVQGRSGAIRFKLRPEALLPRWWRRLSQLMQKRYQL